MEEHVFFSILQLLFFFFLLHEQQSNKYINKILSNVPKQRCQQAAFLRANHLFSASWPLKIIPCCPVEMRCATSVYTNEGFIMPICQLFSTALTDSVSHQKFERYQNLYFGKWKC